MSIDYQAMHAQLLDMLGAKGHQDAARIIAGHHACELARRSEGVSEEVVRSVAKKLWEESSIQPFGNFDDFIVEVRAALNAVLHNRPAQEKAEPMAGDVCPDCNGSGEHCLAGCSAHSDNWYSCETCKGSGKVAPPAERVRVPDGWKLVPKKFGNWAHAALAGVDTLGLSKIDAFAARYEAVVSAAPEGGSQDDEPIEHCESGLPGCGPVEHWDSEGVPLCAKCWDELQAKGGSHG